MKHEIKSPTKRYLLTKLTELNLFCIVFPCCMAYKAYYQNPQHLKYEIDFPYSKYKAINFKNVLYYLTF